MKTKKLAAALTTAALLLGAPVAFAQTGTSTGTGAGITATTSGTGGSIDTTTPGAPNTGAGGDAAANLLVLGISGLVLVAGGAYLARRAATR